jgi:hypothetical protein
LSFLNQRWDFYEIKKEFHLTPSRRLSSKTQTTTNVGEDVGEKEHSYNGGGNHCGK